MVGDTTVHGSAAFGLSLLFSNLPLAVFLWEVKPPSVEIQEAVLKDRTLLPNSRRCHGGYPTTRHSPLVVICPRGSILLHVPISTL